MAKLKGLLSLLIGVSMPNAEKNNGNDAPTNLETATFAGGCFWCMEPPFEGLEGGGSGRFRVYRRT